MAIGKKSLAGGVAGALLLGTVIGSPYITLYQMRSAIEAGDADAFSKHVDFPTLRENFKGQMMAAMNKQMDSKEMAGNPFASLGQAMAVAFVGPMIDAMVSPAGVIAMMKSNSSTPASSVRPTVAVPASDADSHTKLKVNYAVDYRGWDQIVVRAKDASKETGGFVFRRNGIWNWKLTAVDLPDDFMDKAKKY